MEGNARAFAKLAQRFAAEFWQNHHVDPEALGLVDGHDADGAGRFVFLETAVRDEVDQSEPIPRPAAEIVIVGGGFKESGGLARRDGTGGTVNGATEGGGES